MSGISSKGTVAVSIKAHIGLFALLFIHVTCLDMVDIRHNQVVFYWEQTATLKTTLTHLVTALIPTLFIYFAAKLRKLLSSFS